MLFKFEVISRLSHWIVLLKLMLSFILFYLFIKFKIIILNLLKSFLIAFIWYNRLALKWEIWIKVSFRGLIYAFLKVISTVSKCWSQRVHCILLFLIIFKSFILFYIRVRFCIILSWNLSDKVLIKEAFVLFYLLLFIYVFIYY
jgi:hypothetical protein